MGEIINQGEKNLRWQGLIAYAGGDGITEFLNIEELNQPYVGMEATNYVGYCFQIENLLCTYNLFSLDEVPPPAISPEDSMAEKNAKIRELEKTAPHLDLGIYSWELNFNEYYPSWVKKASVPLMNHGGESYLPLTYPFLTSSVVKLLRKDSKLGFKLEGNLGLNDYIILSCDWTQTITYDAKPIEELANTRNFGMEISAIPQLICASQPTRGLIWLQNSGEERIYLYWGLSGAGINPQTAIFIEPGGHVAYESARYRLPQPIWGATASGASYIQGMEAF